jgi:hypothetical protein
MIDEDNCPVQDQVADAEVTRVTISEDSETETTTTENVPDVATDEDKVSASLPAEIPLVRVSVPDVSLADQLPTAHSLFRVTVALLADGVAGSSEACQNSGYDVRILHE